MVFYKKKDFPKEKDIVLCKVKKILPHSVFVDLVEYNNLEGMIHISEISSRWTKNINDVVQLGSMIVCRVEKVNTEKGYIDLSKKRVTSGEEKKKKNEVKNENRIEKLINYAYKKNGLSLKEFYGEAGYELVEDYGSLYNFYEAYKDDPSIIDDLSIKKNIKEDLVKAFESLVQKSRVTVKKEVSFYATGSDGVNDLKEYVKELLSSSKSDDDTLSVTYINSPKYLVSINSKNYKSANLFLEKFIGLMKGLSKKYNINVLE